MSSSKIYFYFCFLIFYLFSNVIATRFVSISGTDSGDCTDPVNPCQTIEYGINQTTADDNTVLIITEGEYICCASYTSNDGIIIASNTTNISISCNETETPVFNFTFTSPNSTTFENLTLVSDSINQSAISIQNADITITNCNFYNSHIEIQNAQILEVDDCNFNNSNIWIINNIVFTSNFSFIHNTFVDYNDSNQNLISLDSIDPLPSILFENNIFQNNTAYTLAKFSGCWFNSTCSIKNNYIEENQAIIFGFSATNGSYNGNIIIENNQVLYNYLDESENSSTDNRAFFDFDLALSNGTDYSIISNNFTENSCFSQKTINLRVEGMFWGNNFIFHQNSFTSYENTSRQSPLSVSIQASIGNSGFEMSDCNFSGVSSSSFELGGQFRYIDVNILRNIFNSSGGFGLTYLFITNSQQSWDSFNITHTFRENTFESVRSNAIKILTNGLEASYLSYDIIDNTFSSCTARQGAAILALINHEVNMYSTNTSEYVIFNLDNNVFQNNQAFISGGALYIYNLGNITITNGKFSDNEAVVGGAMLLDGEGYSSVTNCTFSSDYAEYGSAIVSYILLNNQNGPIATTFQNVNIQPDETFSGTVVTLMAPDITFQNSYLLCPPGSYFYNERDSLSNALECEACLVDTYLFKQSSNTNPIPCLSCNAGTRCLGGISVSIHEGFWGTVDNKKQLLTYNCPQDYCCEGNNSLTCCNYNREGVLCGGCQEGYTETLSSSPKCVKISECHDQFGEFFVRSFLIALVFAVFLILKRKNRGHFHILIFFFQMLRYASYPIYSQSIRSNSQESEMSTVSFLSSLSSLRGIIPDINNFGACPFSSMSAQGKIAVGYITTLEYFIAFFLIWIIVLVYKKIKKCRKKPQSTSEIELNQLDKDDKTQSSQVDLDNIPPPVVTDNNIPPPDDIPVKTDNDFDENLIQAPPPPLLSETSDDDKKKNDDEKEKNDDQKEKKDDEKKDDKQDPKKDKKKNKVKMEKIKEKHISVHDWKKLHHDLKKKHGSFSFSMANSLISLIFFSFVNILETSLQLIKCVRMKVNNKYSYRFFYNANLECLKSWQIPVLVCFILFVVPFPLYILFWRMYYHRHPKNMTPIKEIILNYLERPYKPNRLFWDSLVMFERIVIIVCFVFITDPQLNAVFQSTLFLIYFLIFLHFDPYILKTHSNTELLCGLSLVIISIVSVRQGTIDSTGYNTQTGTELKNTTTAINYLLFFIVIIVLVIGLIKSYGGTILRFLHIKKKEKFD